MMAYPSKISIDVVHVVQLPDKLNSCLASMQGHLDSQITQPQLCAVFENQD